MQKIKAIDNPRLSIQNDLKHRKVNWNSTTKGKAEEFD